jgi:ATP synthase alpha/beta chain, C terminal domain
MPTRQGPDWGAQYRSVLFVADKELPICPLAQMTRDQRQNVQQNPRWPAARLSRSSREISRGWIDRCPFQEGQKPAIDIGTSVSRVGGKTQAPALRGATGSMRLDYAQFLEREMFSRFGGVPDAHVKAQLHHGVRLRALLSQPQYAPLHDRNSR